MRILILAHGHPDLSAGGGERAAYALFNRLKQSSRITQASFVAYASPKAKREAAAQEILKRPDEFLVTPPPFDGFTFQTFGYDDLRQIVHDLIAATQPDVVHIHHFLFWGLEIIGIFHDAGVQVVVTLHEYAAICAHYGQMIRADGQLCDQASPAECAGCFPSRNSGHFFARTTIVRSLLTAADHFIAPSAFLKSRYIAWGLPSDRITVLENPLDPSVVTQSRAQTIAAPAMEGAGRQIAFGYFAQINPFKGFDVLLEAAALLPEDVRHKIVIRVHGENRHYRETEFHTRTEALLAQVHDTVTVTGAYRGEDVIALMAACDWIVVPSIWWENSPVVIQEARLASRPLIVSNIGGMAEKVDPGVDRLFSSGSAGLLAEVITDIVRSQVRPSHSRLSELAQARLQDEEVILRHHEEIYRRSIVAS